MENTNTEYKMTVKIVESLEQNNYRAIKFLFDHNIIGEKAAKELLFINMQGHFEIKWRSGIKDYFGKKEMYYTVSISIPLEKSVGMDESIKPLLNTVEHISIEKELYFKFIEYMASNDKEN